jgi:hypothetical protein
MYQTTGCRNDVHCERDNGRGIERIGSNQYPAHEVRFIFTNDDAADEVEFPVCGRRFRVRLCDLALAAFEVGQSMGEYVSLANYAVGVGPLLEVLRERGWIIQPPDSVVS